mgnify:FL=1
MVQGGKRKGCGRKRLGEAIKRKNLSLTMAPESFIALKALQLGEGLPNLGRALDLIVSVYTSSCKKDEISVAVSNKVD